MMDIVNLVEFVKTGELFDKIEGMFDQVVSDFDFGGLDDFLKIDSVSDFEKVNKDKTTLFVLDKLLPENLDSFFDMKDFCIIDLNFGLRGYGNKIGLSKLDFGTLIEKEIDIYEPFDLLSLLHNLEKNGNKYIRIDIKDLPGGFSDESENDIVFMDKHGLSGEAFCVVTTGSMLPEIVRTVNILNEAGLFVEVIVLNKLNFELTEEMKNKLFHNKNIIYILDLLSASKYEDRFKNQLQDINVKFLYPDYGNLSTVFDEYKSEEIKFDALGLVERLR